MFLCRAFWREALQKNKNVSWIRKQTGDCCYRTSISSVSCKQHRTGWWRKTCMRITCPCVHKVISCQIRAECSLPPAQNEDEVQYFSVILTWSARWIIHASQFFVNRPRWLKWRKMGGKTPRRLWRTRHRHGNNQPLISFPRSPNILLIFVDFARGVLEKKSVSNFDGLWFIWDASVKQWNASDHHCFGVLRLAVSAFLIRAFKLHLVVSIWIW